MGPGIALLPSVGAVLFHGCDPTFWWHGWAGGGLASWQLGASISNEELHDSIFDHRAAGRGADLKLQRDHEDIAVLWPATQRICQTWNIKWPSTTDTRHDLTTTEKQTGDARANEINRTYNAADDGWPSNQIHFFKKHKNCDSNSIIMRNTDSAVMTTRKNCWKLSRHCDQRNKMFVNRLQIWYNECLFQC